MKRGGPLKRKSELKRAPLRAVPPRPAQVREKRPKGISPATNAQRAKVRDQGGCIVCGRPEVDPAHLTPRSLGGCDDVMCVAAVCRAHHRAYDEGRLSLLEHLEPRLREEVQHAVGHLGLLGALVRLTNDRWIVNEERDAA